MNFTHFSKRPDRKFCQYPFCLVFLRVACLERGCPFDMPLGAVGGNLNTLLFSGSFFTGSGSSSSSSSPSSSLLSLDSSSWACSSDFTLKIISRTWILVSNFHFLYVSKTFFTFKVLFGSVTPFHADKIYTDEQYILTRALLRQIFPID